MSTLTAAIDLSDGLAHVGLQQYTELFRQHEIGRPLMELCEETREIWDELFASDLAAVAPCARPRSLFAARRMVSQAARVCAAGAIGSGW